MKENAMNRTCGTHGRLIKSLGICRKVGPEHVN